MSTHSFLAFDLGAESGRAILGSLENKHLHIKETSRFPNEMVSIRGSLHWNIFSLFEEMKKCLKACALNTIDQPESIAVDTWGVDFAILAHDGSILGLPYAYRDSRTKGAMEEFFELVSRERIYKLTGIQFIQFNSLFQLYVMKRGNSPLLGITDSLLFMPDVFNYLFTGEKRTEFTYATTSQLYNPRKKEWAEELFKALGISRTIMQEIVASGTIIGNLNKEICQETGINQMPVIAVASHDTGSAVAAVPAEGKDWVYISSGTWSLMGVETKNPIITDQSRDLNFTNEGGVEGTFRFLKNITGLWLLQECRKTWLLERNHSYEELIQASILAAPFRAFIDPDWDEFLNPQNMPLAIKKSCEKTGQEIPDNPASIVRCILESLALKYRFVLDQLKQIYLHPINRIHIIGGGAFNQLLCQFTANATGLQVIAGPIEATAIGNILVQALSLGYIDSLTEMRKIIQNSFELARYKPDKTAEWDSAYERFRNIIKT